ncbi:MAG: hypothetical protein U0R71_16015 [Solirubrobacterales bacterium]
MLAAVRPPLPAPSIALLLALLALLLPGCGGSAATAHASRQRGEPCNGSTALCSRRLDQVFFPGTHNSYASSSQPGWYFAHQDRGIGAQLEAGIRALTLDVHVGIPEPGGDLVRTDFRAEGAAANKALAATPERARHLARALAGPLGASPSGGPPGLYLCHTLCELGAEPLDRELAAVAAFIESHPREVLVIVVEDYVPAASVAAAFERAGLAAKAAVLRKGEPLPTLGRLLGTGKHLVVFSEQRGGSPPWFMPAFTFIQDTPLGANRPRQLSCARFRGQPDSPLLLVNHWIPPFPPSRRLNAAIGRASFLRRRLLRCIDARGFSGAIVAVDFFERTAVVRVAEQLNRRGS